MEEEEREKLQKESRLLRQELKTWEREFAMSNGGRKAGREDIKKHPAIAQKYKDYNRCRDIILGKAVSQAPSSPHSKTSRKRKNETGQLQTPSKRLQVTGTPSKSASHPAAIDPYDSPSLVRSLFTPSKNRVLGPTPQKDGKALGLFDLLPEEDEESPSKTQIIVTGPDEKVQTTPHKTVAELEEIQNTMRHSRTPASSGKRFMLDSFATPLKRKHPNEQAGRTPSSVSKLHFSTPSFLRRDSNYTQMAPIKESTDDLVISPQMTRLPRKPLVRGLSSMLAGLRKMEEEAADDDLDALREIENGGSAADPSKKSGSNLEIDPVEDSQLVVPFLLGGFDEEAMFDSEPDEIKNPVLGHDGLPLKIWKKKGQKRTTRRVIIKPVRNKPSRAPAPYPDEEPSAPPDEEESDEDLALAADTNPSDPQLPETGAFAADAGNFDSDSASEYTASEGGTRYRRPDQSKNKKKTKKSGVRATARKVGALAHANFKRLKLRNSGAKGGAGYGSRFRRRK